MIYITRRWRRIYLAVIPFLFILTVLSVLFLVPCSASAADLPLDSPVYPILDRLWAEGLIHNYRPDNLPISREEAIVLLEEAGEQQALDQLVGTKTTRISPWLSQENGDRGFIPQNHSGVPVADSLVLGIEAGLDLPPFSLYFDGRIPAADEEDPEFTEAYGIFQFNTFRLSLGKENLWWGPGRRGTFLLTNNAEARPMLRLANYPGFDLPWFFKHLGETRLNFFISRLEEDRGVFVSEPLMGGLQLSFSPHENFVFSLNRTFLYGGEGREEGLKTFFRVLFGLTGFDTSSEQKNVIGNQLGSISFVWRNPSPSQPLVLYGEMAGEDQAKPDFFIKLAAFLGGIYLPRLGQSRLFDLRFEVANNDTDPDRWYTHSDYPYTYKGRIMGHTMGTDARDYYGELGIYPSSNSHIALSTAMTRKLRPLPATGHDILWTYGIKSDYWIQGAIFDLQWVWENWDEVPAGEEEGTLLTLGIKLPL
jgi:hypothetical protein